MAHFAKLALVLIFAFAAKDLTTARGLGPAPAIRVRLLSTLVDFDAERVDDAGFVRAEPRAFGPAVLAHEAMSKASLTRCLGSRCLHCTFGTRWSWRRAPVLVLDPGIVGYLVPNGLSRNSNRA